MSDEHEPPEDDEEHVATVLVFRNGDSQPVPVPEDVVEAAERVYRCHKRRIRGEDWAVIASEEGYESVGACQYDVARWKEEAQALVIENSVREMITLEVARLDALQSALWPAAMKGHVQSAMGAMNIIVNRSKLMGLDPEKLRDDADRARTVVVPADDDSYIAGLRQAALPPK